MLMQMSDAELVQLYDESAPNTQVGVTFYREELARRAADKKRSSHEESHRRDSLTRTSLRVRARDPFTTKEVDHGRKSTLRSVYRWRS